MQGQTNNSDLAHHTPPPPTLTNTTTIPLCHLHPKVPPHQLPLSHRRQQVAQLQRPCPASEAQTHGGGAGLDKGQAQLAGVIEEPSAKRDFRRCELVQKHPYCSAVHFEEERGCVEEPAHADDCASKSVEWARIDEHMGMFTIGWESVNVRFYTVKTT